MSPRDPPLNEKNKKQKNNLLTFFSSPRWDRAPSGWRSWVSRLEKQADSDKASLLQRV